MKSTSKTLLTYVSAVLIAAVFSPWLSQSLARAPVEAEPKIPEVGDSVEDFELPVVVKPTEEARSLKLSEQWEKGPTVLVVLRGYPGYQCPLCARQVVDLTGKAKQIAKRGAQVLLVYPGPKEGLMEKATEFLENAELPKPFEMLIDPDYQVTTAYGLRWDEANETAYPSTFVLDEKGKVVFAKVSRSHGDRTSAEELLKALEEMTR